MLGIVIEKALHGCPERFLGAWRDDVVVGGVHEVAFRRTVRTSLSSRCSAVLRQGAILGVSSRVSRVRSSDCQVGMCSGPKRLLAQRAGLAAVDQGAVVELAEADGDAGLAE